MEELMGRPVADSIDKEISSCGERPCLAVYLIGADRSSAIYARSKVKKGRALGAEVLVREYDPGTSQDTLVEDIRRDSADDEISGIMIERPVPEGISLDGLMSEIPPVKDVEGIKPTNYGLMALGRPRFIPPTPLGAILLMGHYGIDLAGKEVLVLGRSPNVGRPLSILLGQKLSWANATVTLAHSRTRKLGPLLRKADVVLTAVGSPSLITGDMVRAGSVLIDLGINPSPDGGIIGDVDLPSLEGLEGAVTPTPGGTGPVTVSSMFLNLYRASILQKGDPLPFKHPMISMIYGGPRSP